MSKQGSAPIRAAIHPSHGKAVGLAIAAAVGGFLFGFDSSVINGAVDAIKGEFALSAGVTGFAVAVALLGCAAGAWFGGHFADRFGRTKVMLVGAILFFVSGFGSAFAVGVGDFIVWRIIGGLGIGIASVIAPAYIAEIAPAAMRGRLASLQQLAITLGIFAALLSDAVFANSAGGASEVSLFGIAAWQWMFLVSIVPAAIYGILALRIPESPRFLVGAGRRDEALKVLTDVLGGDEDPVARVAQIEASLEADKAVTSKASLRGSVLGLLPIVWVGILLSVFQQFVGINVIFYYSTTLWQTVGFTEQMSFVASVITSITNVAVTLIAIALVDRIGRRPILLTGSAGMTIALGVMALAFTHSSGSGAGVSLAAPWGPIALVAANLFVVFFGASWGPVVWVLLGEMFPNRIRAAALGLAAAAQWIANFAITISFPPLLAAFGPTVPYLMYAVFAALSFFFVLVKIPETKGVELEDMADVTVARAAPKR
ncbi:sugar porter family MFS transporter [Pengzhenrongella sp.]|jgi:sugar porter (SP) family MFS transporter|uniref:sugar porter family MFS transporter n=1 Tax=Pengzhenrongella sp. TaxID=2888820 RepID=UPI002F94DD92